MAAQNDIPDDPAQRDKRHHDRRKADRRAIGENAVGDGSKNSGHGDADRPERPTRIDVSVEALLTTSDGHSFPVVIRDISSKGCRIEHDDQVIVGECVSLKVDSEDAMIAEIKWALGREAGGHFLDPVPDVDK